MIKVGVFLIKGGTCLTLFVANKFPHLCAVIIHPVSYSTVDEEVQHTDGELQHTGWGVTAY